MREIDLQSNIRLHISENCPGSILFRSNVGEAWSGDKIEKLPDGTIKIHKPRRFRSGLPTGFPDLFGLQTIEITSEMIGQRLAVFTAFEVKTQTGRVRPEQQHMIEFLVTAGARAGVVRSIEDVNNLLRR